MIKTIFYVLLFTLLARFFWSRKIADDMWLEGW